VLDDLLDGRGFVLIRGLPVATLSDRQMELLFWGIGQYLGIPIPQNDAGDLLIHVRDEGLDFANPIVRGYQTRQRLDYHSDSSDIVGLLCRRPAKSGGVSTIVSCTEIHDEMVRRRPDLAALLHEYWWFDRRKANTPDNFFERRICAVHNGRLLTHYGRAHIESASRGEGIPPLTDRQREALDLFDSLLNSPEYVLNMDFQPGDVQFLNNYVIMHARTDYEDWPEPERRRDLCRIWLTVRRDLDLPPDFSTGGITSRRAAFG
ncbi:MAG TPA: TauD/TfdA family dioxygenase, partial [Acidimicrobiales bacterium]|jgi:hypothetical protein|nr:TauD/TfdA family dioxygenase [Acidimicrobiales bacterium]